MNAAWLAWSLLLLPAQTAATTPLGPDTLVVCPRHLREALLPWVELRQAQGHRVAFLRQATNAANIRRDIREVARSGTLRWVLLVGDAPAPGTPPSASAIPTHYEPAKIIARFGHDREIATDNWYADLDDDGAPDLAIGRITADSSHDLAAIVQKILAFENVPATGAWRERISFVAGVGGFGGLIDGAIETATRKFLTEQIPAAYKTTMTYGSWRSPFCPDPRRFHDVAVDRLNEGCLFWVYLGHGQPYALDHVRVPGGTFHIMDVNDMPRLQCQDGLPIAVMLACYTGAFDAARDCLGEEMLRTPGGPVSIVCSSRTSMPYAMAVMGTAMMHECFHERRETLGEVVLQAKRSMLSTIDDQDDPRWQTRQLLDAVASLLMLNGDTKLLDDERREHAALFQLLGDPLLSLRPPASVEVDIARQVAAGSALPVTLRSPVSGRCTVELVCRRDKSKVEFPRRSEFDASEAGLSALDQSYEQAHDISWHSMSLELSGAETTLEFSVPSDARGLCVLRVYVSGDRQDALGATPIYIQPAVTHPVTLSGE
jgi:hypothetical protein